MAMATYSKLRDGSWGLRGSDLVEGQQVTVTRRDGTRRIEYVGRILWRGDGVALATMRAADARRPGRSRGCHTDGECSSMCSPSTCLCGNGSWFSCC